jgi:hypothetical protein
MLTFSDANAKTEALYDVPELAEFLQDKRKVYSLDLLSGWSCPFAEACLSKATILPNGKRKIKDGPKNQFRCFSASQEVQYTGVYNRRKVNFDLLKSNKNKAKLIGDSLPKNLGICRIHVAGDFFSQDYLNAWLQVAADNPSRLFYAYTKSLRYWLAAMPIVDSLDNFVLTASYGGRDDSLIEENGLRSARVIFSESEANGLDIDHDDSHAARPSMWDQDFCLLLHGIQPKGSDASVALRELKGKGSYSRK